MTTMTSKFNGFCKNCNRTFAAGTLIRWSRETGAQHLVCGSDVPRNAQNADGRAQRFAAQQQESERARISLGLASAPVVAPVVVAPSAPSVVSEAQAPIAAFIEGAKANGLKFPKARFLAPNGGELLLSVAGPMSKAPGSIQVKIDGNWVGRIEPSGAVVGYALKGDAVLLATLSAIAEDPAGRAKAYGSLRGHCSFCDKKLDDAGSIEHGYGPVCASRFGLPWKKGGVAKLTQQVPVAA